MGQVFTWDAYEATGEKPSYLLYGSYPIEAAFLPANEVEGVDLTGYRCDRNSLSIQKTQKHCKKYYNKVNKCSPMRFKIGGLVLFRFPQEESGKFQKLSRLWHGPYIYIEFLR